MIPKDLREPIGSTRPRAGSRAGGRLLRAGGWGWRRMRQRV